MREKILVPRTADGLAEIVRRYNAINRTDLIIVSKSANEAEHNDECRRRNDSLMQMMTDVTLISLHDAFGIAETRLVRFSEAFHKRWAWILDIAKSDLESMEEGIPVVENMVMTKKKLNDELQSILGDHYEDWETRYR